MTTTQTPAPAQPVTTGAQASAMSGTDEELRHILGEDFQIVACTRVWEAWQYGTMTEDDFIPAAESDLPAELIAWRDAAVAAVRAELAALRALAAPAFDEAAADRDERARYARHEGRSGEAQRHTQRAAEYRQARDEMLEACRD